MAEKTLVMTFLNEQGAKANVSLPGIKDDLTEAQVSAVMDTIVEKNIFYSTGGNLAAKNAAQITERNVTTLEVR